MQVAESFGENYTVCCDSMYSSRQLIISLIIICCTSKAT